MLHLLSFSISPLKWAHFTSSLPSPPPRPLPGSPLLSPLPSPGPSLLGKTHPHTTPAGSGLRWKQQPSPPGLPRGARVLPPPQVGMGIPARQEAGPPPCRREPPRACEPGPLNATACTPAGPLPRRPAANGAISGSPSRSRFPAWGVAGGGGPRS